MNAIAAVKAQLENSNNIEESNGAKKMKHLRYSMRGAFDHSNAGHPHEPSTCVVQIQSCRHPQLAMKELGITYQHSTPQSICDQWWFWNCENIPDEIPDFITDLNLDPMEQIGWGLSKESAEKIRDFKGEQHA